MASLFDLNSGSSDSEDDVDYVPPNAAESDLSEDECSDDETEVGEEPLPKKIKLSAEKGETKTEPTVNKSADDVWKSFLQGVKSTPYGKANGKPNEQAKETLQSTSMNKLESATKDKDAKTEDRFADDKVPNSDDAVPKKEDTLSEENIEKISVITDQDKVIVTYDPEKFSVTTDDKVVPDIIDPDKDIKIDDKDVKKEKPVDVLITRPRTGLSSVLGSIANKGKKPSVLEKSLADWKSFKEEQGIQKDLETFNKGRAGYIERQRFLQRSDIRSFENEKNIRLSGRKNPK